MSNRIIIKLTPNHSVTLSVPTKSNFSNPWESTIQVVNWMTIFVIAFFILGIIAANLILGGKTGSGYILWLYYGVIILAALQTIHRIFAKGAFLPQVPYDILFLLYTTIISCSLFIYTTSAEVGFNIWGGIEYRIFSAVSVIALFLYYYIFVVNNASKDKLARNIRYLLIAPVIFLGFSLIQGRDAKELLLVALIPGMFYYILNGTGWRIKLAALVSIILGIYSMEKGSPLDLLIVTVATAVIVLGILAVHRKNILKLFSDFDQEIEEVIKKKLNPVTFLKQNGEVIFFVFGSVFVLIATILTIDSGKNTILKDLQDGLQSLYAQDEVLKVLLGNGFTGSKGTYITMLIETYGVIAFIIFMTIIVLFLRDLERMLQKSIIRKSIRLSVFILGSFFISTFVILLLTESSDLMVIYFWILFGILGSMKMLFLDKTEFQLESTVRTFSRVKNLRQRRLLSYLQFVALLVMILGGLILIYGVANIAQYLTI